MGHALLLPMTQGYQVTRRGPDGRALEVRCSTHPECKWTMASAGARSDADPIFVMQFARHLELASDTGTAAFGYARRSRNKPAAR